MAWRVSLLVIQALVVLVLLLLDVVNPPPAVRVPG